MTLNFCKLAHTRLPKLGTTALKMLLTVTSTCTFKRFNFKSNQLVTRTTSIMYDIDILITPKLNVRDKKRGEKRRIVVDNT